MLTSPTWLPTGWKNQVHGLIDWVTLPDSGKRKAGMDFSLSPREAAAKIGRVERSATRQSFRCRHGGLRCALPALHRARLAQRHLEAALGAGAGHHRLVP